MKRIHVFDVAPTPTPGGMVGDRPLEEPTVSGSWRVAGSTAIASHSLVHINSTTRRKQSHQHPGCPPGFWTC